MLNVLIVDDFPMILGTTTSTLSNVLGATKDELEAIELTKKIKEYDKDTISTVGSTDCEEDILMSFRESATGYILNPFTINGIKKEIGNTFPEYYVKIHKEALNDK